jgi:hypothetical protein
MSLESGDTIHASTVASRSGPVGASPYTPMPAGHIDGSPEALLEAQVSRHCRRDVGRGACGSVHDSRCPSQAFEAMSMGRLRHSVR